MSKKLFKPENIKDLVFPSDCTISGGAEKAAWVENRSNKDLKSFESKIALADLKAQKINYLDVPDSDNPKHPRLLSDASALLYLGKRSGEYQIYARNLASGEDKKLTSARHGVTRFSVSKDETMLAFETTLWDEEIEKGLEFTEMSEGEKKAWEEELDLRPYEATDIMYKRNEWFGMRKGELQRTAIVSVSGNGQRLLPFAGLETEYPVFSGGNDAVYCYAYPHSGTKARNFELFEIDVRSGNYKQITKDLELYGTDFPLVSDDGSVLLPAIYVTDKGGMSIEAYKIDPKTCEGKFFMQPGDAKISHGVFEVCASHTAYGEHREAIIKDGYYYFLTSFKGRGNVCRKNLSGDGKTELYRRSNGHIHAFDIANDGSIVYIEGTLDAPAEVFFLKSGEEKPVRLTDLNAWLSDYEVAKTEEFWVKSSDGKFDLQVWLTHPALEEKGKKYPVVLDIHGGPTASTQADFWHEVQALAGAGCAVIMTNPRGSLGYGPEFCEGPVCWKWEAMQDLLDVLDASIAKGFIDEKRVGVTGGSYGGYSTNKLIGRTKRFAAAVTQRCLVNPGTSYGTGDMGYKSANPEEDKMTMLEYMEDRVRGNLITYIDNIKIPVLILHGYKDYRCSFEQAEQMFVAMKDRNPEVPCRLVMFPTENHDLTRTGRPSNQIRHLQEMTDWFVKYLSEDACKEREAQNE